MVKGQSADIRDMPLEVERTPGEATEDMVGGVQDEGEDVNATSGNI